jgi:hypothetical protein
MGLFDARKRFARQVVSVFHSAGVAEAVYDPGEFAIRVRLETGEHATAYLINIFHECDGVPREERRGRIARYVAAMVADPGIPGDWTSAAPLLRTVLRPVTYGQGRVTDRRPLGREVLPMLNEMVVIDLPHSLAYVTIEQAGEWGMPEKVVFDQARRNVAALPALPPAAGPTVLHLQESGEEYWSSRLMIDGWLAAMEPYVGGRPVAVIPDTTGMTLLVDAPEHLGDLLEKVEKMYREAVRPISPMLYTVDHRGTVVPYEVAPDDPLGPALHRAEQVLATAEYGAQVIETDAFVAGAMLAERPDGTTFSFASWGDGVDTLLPRVDFVSFPSDDADTFFVSWRTLEREVDLEPEPGVVPERFRLRTWPHPGVVARLRAAATLP